MADGAFSWRQRLGLERGTAALAGALFVYGFGEELWSRYVPEYLRVLGAGAFAVGLFGALKDFLDAAYAYPGGVLTDRLGAARSLLLFGGLTGCGTLVYFFFPSIAGLFLGLLLVRAWASLGLPATFALIGQELPSGRRIAGFTVQAVVKRVPIVLAPPLGGLLLERFGMRGGIRIGFAVAAVLSIAMLARLRRGLRDVGRRTSAPVTASPRPSPGRRRSRLPASLRQLLIADCLVRLCEGLPDVFLVVWAIEIVGITPAQFGLLTSVLMATAI